MDHIDAISLEELHRALDQVDGSLPTQRLCAAIAYKHGTTQTELAEWHDAGRRTIYNWLMRLDTDEPLETAVTDDSRPGRRRKLTPAQHASFTAAVRADPTAVGIDAETWTPARVQTLLQDTYDVEYSLPSCRRLLREAGLAYRHGKWVVTE
jgi:transposase